MKELDVVYLKDGRKGTIVHLYPDGKTAEVEVSDTNEVETVKLHTLKEMKKFRLYWLDGKTEIVEGSSITEAFMNAGYGNGAMKALDFHDNGDIQSYEWNSVEQKWRMKPSHMEATSGC